MDSNPVVLDIPKTKDALLNIYIQKLAKSKLPLLVEQDVWDLNLSTDEQEELSLTNSTQLLDFNTEYGVLAIGYGKTLRLLYEEDNKTLFQGKNIVDSMKPGRVSKQAMKGIIQAIKFSPCGEYLAIVHFGEFEVYSLLDLAKETKDLKPCFNTPIAQRRPEDYERQMSRLFWKREKDGSLSLTALIPNDKKGCEGILLIKGANEANFQRKTIFEHNSIATPLLGNKSLIIFDVNELEIYSQSLNDSKPSNKINLKKALLNDDGDELVDFTFDMLNVLDFNEGSQEFSLLLAGSWEDGVIIPCVYVINGRISPVFSVKNVMRVDSESISFVDYDDENQYAFSYNILSIDQVNLKILIHSEQDEIQWLSSLKYNKLPRSLKKNELNAKEEDNIVILVDTEKKAIKLNGDDQKLRGITFYNTDDADKMIAAGSIKQTPKGPTVNVKFEDGFSDVYYPPSILFLTRDGMIHRYYIFDSEMEGKGPLTMKTRKPIPEKQAKPSLSEFPLSNGVFENSKNKFGLTLQLNNRNSEVDKNKANEKTSIFSIKDPEIAGGNIIKANDSIINNTGSSSSKQLPLALNISSVENKPILHTPGPGTFGPTKLEGSGDGHMGMMQSPAFTNHKAIPELKKSKFSFADEKRGKEILETIDEEKKKIEVKETKEVINPKANDLHEMANQKVQLFNDVNAISAAQNLGSRKEVLVLMATLLDKFRINNFEIPFNMECKPDDSRWSRFRNEAKSKWKLGNEKKSCLRNLIEKEVLQAQREAKNNKCLIPYLSRLLGAFKEKNHQTVNEEIPELQTIPEIDMVLKYLERTMPQVRQSMKKLEVLKQLSIELRKIDPNTVNRSLDNFKEKEKQLGGDVFLIESKTKGSVVANNLFNKNQRNINLKSGITLKNNRVNFNKTSNTNSLYSPSAAVKMNVPSEANETKSTTSSKAGVNNSNEKLLKLENFIRDKLDAYNKITENLLKIVNQLEKKKVQEALKEKKKNGVDLRFVSLSSDEESDHELRSEKATVLESADSSNKNKSFLISTPAVQNPNDELEIIFKSCSKDIKTKTLTLPPKDFLVYEKATLKQNKSNASLGGPANLEGKTVGKEDLWKKSNASKMNEVEEKKSLMNFKQNENEEKKSSSSESLLKSKTNPSLLMLSEESKLTPNKVEKREPSQNLVEKKEGNSPNLKKDTYPTKEKNETTTATGGQKTTSAFSLNSILMTNKQGEKNETKDKKDISSQFGRNEGAASAPFDTGKREINNPTVEKKEATSKENPEGFSFFGEGNAKMKLNVEKKETTNTQKDPNMSMDKKEKNPAPEEKNPEKKQTGGANNPENKSLFSNIKPEKEKSEEIPELGNLNIKKQDSKIFFGGALPSDQKSTDSSNSVLNQNMNLGLFSNFASNPNISNTPSSGLSFLDHQKKVGDEKKEEKKEPQLVSLFDIPTSGLSFLDHQKKVGGEKKEEKKEPQPISLLKIPEQTTGGSLPSIFSSGFTLNSHHNSNFPLSDKGVKEADLLKKPLENAKSGTLIFATQKPKPDVDPKNSNPVLNQTPQNTGIVQNQPVLGLQRQTSSTIPDKIYEGVNTSSQNTPNINETVISDKILETKKMEQPTTNPSRVALPGFGNQGFPSLFESMKAAGGFQAPNPSTENLQGPQPNWSLQVNPPSMSLLGQSTILPHNNVFQERPNQLATFGETSFNKTSKQAQPSQVLGAKLGTFNISSVNPSTMMSFTNIQAGPSFFDQSNNQQISFPQGLQANSFLQNFNGIFSQAQSTGLIESHLKENKRASPSSFKSSISQMKISMKPAKLTSSPETNARNSKQPNNYIPLADRLRMQPTQNVLPPKGKAPTQASKVYVDLRNFKRLPTKPSEMVRRVPEWSESIVVYNSSGMGGGELTLLEESAQHWKGLSIVEPDPNCQDQIRPLTNSVASSQEYTRTTQMNSVVSSQENLRNHPVNSKQLDQARPQTMHLATTNTNSSIEDFSTTRPSCLTVFNGGQEQAQAALPTKNRDFVKIYPSSSLVVAYNQEQIKKAPTASLIINNDERLQTNTSGGLSFLNSQAERKTFETQESLELPHKKKNFAIPNMLYFKKSKPQSLHTAQTQKMSKCLTEKSPILNMAQPSEISPRPRFLMGELLKNTSSVSQLNSFKASINEMSKKGGMNSGRIALHNMSLKQLSNSIRGSVRSLSPEIPIFKPTGILGGVVSPKEKKSKNEIKKHNQGAEAVPQRKKPFVI